MSHRSRFVSSHDKFVVKTFDSFFKLNPVKRELVVIKIVFKI